MHLICCFWNTDSTITMFLQHQVAFICSNKATVISRQVSKKKPPSSISINSPIYSLKSVFKFCTIHHTSLFIVPPAINIRFNLLHPSRRRVAWAVSVTVGQFPSSPQQLHPHLLLSFPCPGLAAPHSLPPQQECRSLEEYQRAWLTDRRLQTSNKVNIM